MWRFLIFFTLLPFLLGGASAHFFGRNYWRAAMLSDTVSEILGRVLAQMQRSDIEITFANATPWNFLTDDGLRLPARYQHSQDVRHVAKALIWLELFQLREKHQSAINWRVNLLKISYVFPIFTLLVVFFIFLLAKLPAVFAVLAITGSLGLSSVLLWLSLAVEREAAHLMVSRIERLRIMPRLRDEELLIASLRAAPWISLIPGALQKLVLKD